VCKPNNNVVEYLIVVLFKAAAKYKNQLTNKYFSKSIAACDGAWRQ
jgi:hypothetical protein